MSPLRGLFGVYGLHFATIMSPLRGYFEGGRLKAEGGIQLRITKPKNFN